MSSQATTPAADISSGAVRAGSVADVQPVLAHDAGIGLHDLAAHRDLGAGQRVLVAVDLGDGLAALGLGDSGQVNLGGWFGCGMLHARRHGAIRGIGWILGSSGRLGRFLGLVVAAGKGHGGGQREHAGDGCLQHSGILQFRWNGDDSKRTSLDGQPPAC